MPLPSFGPQPFRPEPGLPTAAMQTWSIDGHMRRASCEEVACEHRTMGWVTAIDESTELGRRQAAYIRSECRPEGQALASSAGVRRYTERRTPAGLTEFVFPAGQKCFGLHKVPADRPEIYTVRGGDWRGNPTGFRRRHKRAEDWVEHFAEHLDGLHTLHERG